MIEIDNITVLFGGNTILDKLSASLESSSTAIIGPNGAGKTTLLNVLSGFVSPSGGTIRIDGSDLVAHSPHRRARLGVRRSFQVEQIVDVLTVEEHLQAVLDNLPVRPTHRTDDAAEVLEFVGLVDRATALGRELVAHERRMLEIARAIVGQPRVILLDEPGAGLSGRESERLRQVMQELPGFTGAQLLLIDHDVELVKATCTMTLVLDFGCKVAYGPTLPTLQAPQVRTAYLGVEL